MTALKSLFIVYDYSRLNLYQSATTTFILRVKVIYKEVIHMESHKKKHQTESQDQPDLRGTLISVGILGVFIIVSWLGVWYLFISR